MSTYMVNASEMRQKTALITQELRTGDSFIIVHYKSPVGYLTQRSRGNCSKSWVLKVRASSPR
jgi:hypothetical protein